MMTGPALNRMLELRIKDLAARPPELSREDLRLAVLRSLGLEPFPPRTDLSAHWQPVQTGPGYRRIGVRFASRPGLEVSAHLYLPAAEGKVPLVVRTTERWPNQKSDPVTQAGAIGLANSGFAVLVVDAPGGTEALWNERATLGDPNYPLLAVGAPALGVYVWDLMRAIDLATSHPEVDGERIGITGGLAALLTFAVDPRIRAAASVGGFSSREERALALDFAEALPGLAALGDLSEVLSLRREDGALMLMVAEEDCEFGPSHINRREERLSRAFGSSRWRAEKFPFGPDYNRRMREAAAAFFAQHLRGEIARPYLPEPIPLTDGYLNPAPANTLPVESPELLVGLAPGEQTFVSIAQEALAARYPQKWEPMRRLVAWNRFGTLPKFAPAGIVAIHDEGLEPKEPDSYALAIDGVELRLLHSLAFTLSEVHAQILHLTLAGAPAGWEERGLAGDALTSLVASMRTLIGETPTGPPPGLLIAEGPVASLAAIFLKQYRPDLTIHVSHAFGSWEAAIATGNPLFYAPLARYLEFPSGG